MGHSDKPGFGKPLGYHNKKLHQKHGLPTPKFQIPAAEPVHGNSEERFSKGHEFAIFVVFPVVIVLIFQPPICVLWLLLFVPLMASLDLGRKKTKEWKWPKWARVLLGIAAITAFGAVGYKSIDEHTKPIFVYLRPGFATFDDRINWTLLTVVRTNHPVYNIKTEIDDEVTGRTVLSERRARPRHERGYDTRFSRVQKLSRSRSCRKRRCDDRSSIVASYRRHGSGIFF